MATSLGMHLESYVCKKTNVTFIYLFYSLSFIFFLTCYVILFVFNYIILTSPWKYLIRLSKLVIGSL